MSDLYTQIANNPIGKIVFKNAGLPQPVPLERYSPGDPVISGRVLLGAAPGGRVVGVGLQRRMVDLRHLRMDGEAGRDGARVLALAAHPQGQRLEAAVREPGLEGTEHAPDELT